MQLLEVKLLIKELNKNNDLSAKLIFKTHKKMGDLFVHYGTVEKGFLQINDNINLK